MYKKRQNDLKERPKKQQTTHTVDPAYEGWGGFYLSMPWAPFSHNLTTPGLREVTEKASLMSQSRDS